MHPALRWRFVSDGIRAAAEALCLRLEVQHPRDRSWVRDRLRAAAKDGYRAGWDDAMRATSAHEMAHEKGRQLGLASVAAVIRENASGETIAVAPLLRWLERHACRCHGEETDPGPDHIAACPFSDPDFMVDEVPF